MNALSAANGRARQYGAALIEFAFVLPFLLAITIGIIYYGYVFMLDAAVKHAAKQGAQVAVNIDPVAFPSSGAYTSEVTTQVTTSVNNSLAWLPESVRDNLADPPLILQFLTPDGGQPGTLLSIMVMLNVAGGSSPVLPQIVLPGIGAVPPLPPTLTGVAQVVL